ncbi:MAG: cation:proton antiporter [Candidatus Kapaibacteriota bacterium]|jgi:CPA2 family monovalent cation:H+ antiporter-2
MNLLLSIQIPFINEVVLIFGIAILVVYLFSKLNFPAIIGFLITGVVAGPYGLKLSSDIEQVQILAEIGVIFILFSIGLEVSLRKLLENKNAILIGGTLQVLLTIMFVSFLVNLLGFAPNQSIFIGFLLALSSTAIVLNIVQSKGMINSPQGQIILAVLIFQDIIIVPMMLLTPILAGQVESLATEILSLIAKVIGIIVFVYLATKYIMPWIMYKIAKTRLKEIFLLATIFICFSIVYVAGILGLSLALGAFLAGLCISDTDYNHQALSNIVPFKDVFSSFFFISVGMLLDIHFFIIHIHIIAIIVLSIIFIKIISGFISTLALKYPVKIAFLVSFSIAQVGEFSFVLAIVGMSAGLIDNETYQYFLSSTVATMGITPLLFAIAPKISKRLSKHKLFSLVEKSIQTINNEIHSEELNHHLVIIGFGVNGRNLSLAAKHANIPYIIVETNPETVKKEKKLGEPIIFGDATNNEVLESTNHHKAKICVIAISDPTSTRSIIHNIRKHNKEIYIIVRTRFVSEMSDLYKLGANEVIPEEFETSVEIFTRVLNKYLIPKNEIEYFIQNVRSDGYKMFRSVSKLTNYTDLKLHIPDFDVLTFKIKENSIYLSKTIIDLDLRQKFQLNILAIKRDDEIITNPSPDLIFITNDIIILFGSRENLRKFEKNI